MIQKYFKMGIGLALFSALVLVGVLAGSAGAASTISHVMVTDVRNKSFVVSWITTTPSDGTVTWGTVTPPGTSTADGAASTTTHYARISGLSSNTTYYFQVSSGTDVDDNGGAYYQVHTGPALMSIPGQQVEGYLFASDGETPVPNGIVYLQLQDADGSGSSGSSQWVSARADSSGYWYYNLADVRTSNYSAFFSYTPGTDKLRIIGQGGESGTLGLDPTPFITTVTTANPFQVNVHLIQSPTAVTVSSFSGESRPNAVQLDWETANEVSLVGFNVYRSETVDGVKEKLNASLLPARNPGQMVGSTYHYNDAVQPGKHYYYWLELVQTEGSELISPAELNTDYWILLPVIFQ